jgi:uncharacterized protein YigE (DUF2233 family)
MAVLLAAICGSFGANALAASHEAALLAVTFQGQTYTVHTVDPQKEDLQLFLNDDQDKPLHDFVALDKYVAAKGEHLLFAANAGMFEPTFKPCGLLVQDEKEISPLNLNDAPGNFYMKPNGVFLINEKHEARVIESSEYPTMLTPAVWAMQSGPLLVHGGSIHPDFNADSKSVKIRSGVGVRQDGTIVFALSRTPVTFYDFADLFLTKLECPNALFLDGDISAFYTPAKNDTLPHAFGPMIGVVQKSK